MDQERTTRHWQRTLGGILLVVALVLLGLSGEQVYRGQQKRETWRRAEGVVVQVVKGRDGYHGSDTTRPIYAYTDPATGKRHKITGKLSTNLTHYYPGQKIELLYPEGKPEAAIPDTVLELYHPAIGLGVGALVLAAMGLGLRRGVIMPRAYVGADDTEPRLRVSGMNIPLPGGLLSRLFSLSELRGKAAPPPPDAPDCETEDRPT